ncbi:MAG: amidohydrolase family protein [Alteromonadaceae bacterium]|nr:amidohydrolase family protein [Alteromonadaceae bacterium]
MKIRIITTALLLMACKVQSQELLIDNVSIVSAHLPAKLLGQYIRIVDGRIADISATALKPLTENPTRINGTGKYLTPGIMDSHVHIGAVPGIGFINSDMARQHSDLVDAYFQQQPKSFLYYGVTQVLNLGATDGQTEFESASVHPDYFTCQPIPVVGGYPAIDAEYTLNNSPYFIVDDDNEADIPSHIDRAQHTPEAVVAAIASTDAACIKIYIEDGFGGASHWPMLSDSTLSRIRKAADRHQMQVWAHANAIDMYQIALKHNVDGVAHGMWNWQWPQDQNNPPVSQTLDKLIATDTAYMPTIQVMLALHGMFDDTVLSDTKRHLVLPQKLIAWFDTAEGQWFKQEVAADFGDLPDAKISELLGYGVGRAQQAANYLFENNHPLLLASDYPSSPSFAAAPGLSTHIEIQQMAAAGVSAKAIFAAATLNGPKQFGMQNDYGTVEAGKIANLLLLEKDPSTSVTHWESLDTVILHGTPIKRQVFIANQ